MNNTKFNDWQEMALKKDTEVIIKRLNDQGKVIVSLVVDAMIAVISIVLDHLVDGQVVHSWVWKLLIVSAVAIPAILLLSKIIKFLNSLGKARSGKYSIKKYVDIFDNQICYFVMTCGSYSRLLKSGTDISKEEQIVLYQEGSYFNNKAMMLLYDMKPVIRKVFTNDASEVIKKTLVSFCRLSSLIRLIHAQQVELDKSIEPYANCASIKDQQAVNTQIQSYFLIFENDVNRIYNTGCSLPS